MVNRDIKQDEWWTQNIQMAVNFHTKAIADRIVERMKYNNPEVVEYNDAIKFHNQNKGIE